MPDDRFEIECNRLSNAVDAVQYERVRWSKNEGPMLDRLVELARSTIEERPDFELTDEGSKGAVRRFILKVHGFRIVAVNLGIESGRIVVWGETIERSKYQIIDGRRCSADFDEVDDAWMKGALRGVMGEVQ